MNWQDVVRGLFGSAHTMVRTGDLLSGTGTINQFLAVSFV